MIVLVWGVHMKNQNDVRVKTLLIRLHIERQPVYSLCQIDTGTRQVSRPSIRIRDVFAQLLPFMRRNLKVERDRNTGRRPASGCIEYVTRNHGVSNFTSRKRVI